ncbi:MAG: O-antigen ligase [Bacteroidetes bacterium]|nr:O-antigen ligase [Bacteroidota bacterium]
MIYFIILIVIILILISKKSASSKLAFILITIYILWYGFWLCISTFNLYNLKEVSDKVYLYQLLGMGMLVIGFLIHPNTNMRNKVNNVNRSINLEFEKSNGFKLFFIISLIYAFPVFMTFRTLILIGESNVRTMYFYDNKALIFGHRYLGLIWGWIGSPLFYLLMLLICIRIINNKYLNLRTLLYTLFVVFYGFVGAGRQNYITFIEMLCFVYFINLKTNLFKINNYSILKSILRKPKFLIKLLFLFSIIFLSLGYITSIRLGNNDFTFENSLDGLNIFFEQIVAYNIGPFRAFDYALSNNYIEKIGQLYGRGTFAAVDNLIYTIFAYLRIELYVPANHIIGSVLQNDLIDIGGNFKNFNYAYTQFMIFYLDFGVFGIAIISILQGYFYRKIVNYFLFNTNFFSLLLLLFFSLSLMGSNFAYGLQPQESITFILGLLYFSKKYKGYKIINNNIIE